MNDTALPTPAHVTWEQTELLRLLSRQPGTRYQECTPAEQANWRAWVIKILSTDCAAQVTFVKANGAQRVMRCTRNWGLIPADVAKIPTDVAKTDNASTVWAANTKPEQELHTVVVYDLEAKGWRSFRLDRLQKITLDIDLA